MKKTLKITSVIILTIIITYTIFITIEVKRFNKNLGVKPLITINEQTTKQINEKIYTGLGYTIKYEYYAIQNEKSDHKELIIQSGEFKLFGKLPISMWIQ